MSELQNELEQLTKLITEKQGFLNDLERLKIYKEKLKVVQKNSNILIRGDIDFRAEEGVKLDSDKNSNWRECVSFSFKDPAIIKWILSVLSLILEFKGAILKEELADIKKEKK